MYIIYMINDTAASPIIPNSIVLIISCFDSRTGLVEFVATVKTLEKPVKNKCHVTF